MKPIIFCADDYGQNEAISQAIISLLIQKRLSAVSCLVTSPFWLSHSKWLADFKDQADIGLHFNLTEGQPLTTQHFYSLKKLLLKASLRQLNLNSIIKELNAQIDCFSAGYGQLPDFIDGHQHVHHLPIIREAIMSVYEKRLRANQSYVRSVSHTYPFGNAWCKKFILQLTGAYRFKKILASKQIPYNHSFSGIYDFKQAQNYPVLCASFVQQVQDRGIIMCHPAKSSADVNDLIGQARVEEFEFLQSAEFIQLCQKYAIIISRFR